ncbi:MAG: class I SAM-dependent methyltransferase [Gemmatimonadetes bacterium]|nr:class I SAM-dependent methyltransferase [Gemmatimonadota bacterium]
MAPLGLYELRRMLADGLPAQLRRPLEFLFDGRLEPAERQVVDGVERIREAVARDPRGFRVVNRDGVVHPLTASQVAHRASINREWGTFLHLCSRSFGARTILELGGCAGISGCYLTASERCERFVTVEGSAELAALAAENLGRLSDRAEVVNSLFDDALDRLLPTFRDGIGLAYLDGHHKYEATLHYLERLEPYLGGGALVVFDDIRLSRGMWKAWRTVEGREGFAATVDAGRFGLAVWAGSTTTPVSHDLSLPLGFLRGVYTG